MKCAAYKNYWIAVPIFSKNAHQLNVVPCMLSDMLSIEFTKMPIMNMIVCSNNKKSNLNHSGVY